MSESKEILVSASRAVEWCEIEWNSPNCRNFGQPKRDLKLRNISINLLSYSMLQRRPRLHRTRTAITQRNDALGPNESLDLITCLVQTFFPIWRSPDARLWHSFNFTANLSVTNGTLFLFFHSNYCNRWYADESDALEELIHLNLTIDPTIKTCHEFTSKFAWNLNWFSIFRKPSTPSVKTLNGLDVFSVISVRF